MTPDRKDLADELERLAEWEGAVRGGCESVARTMRQAAAALRQEPSVEEIVRVLEETIDAERRGPAEGWIEITGISEAAQAIQALWSRSP